MTKCPNCEQMKKENKGLRSDLMATSREYVDVVNENLALKRELGR